MRRFFLLTIVALLTVASYAAMPFLSAWKIREAIRHGDAAYLEAKVDWPSFKDSLKPSLSRIALDMPLEPGAEPAQKPSLWQRLKQRWGRGLVERAVDGYVTPEGLTRLFSLRKSYRQTVSGTADPDEGRPLGERVKAFWARVKRAEFTTPTRFELDVVDKTEPTRLFAGVLELRGFDWKLTELRIRDSGHATDPATTAPSDTSAGPAGADADGKPLASANAPEGSPLER